jgi:hypothetical protein
MICSVLVRAKRPLTAHEIAKRAGLRLNAVHALLKDRCGWAPRNRRLYAQQVRGTTVYSYKLALPRGGPSRVSHTMTTEGVKASKRNRKSHPAVEERRLR